MTDNVIPLNMFTTQEIPVDRVLDGAKEKNLTRVLVIAETEEGKLYLAASHASHLRAPELHLPHPRS